MHDNKVDNNPMLCNAFSTNLEFMAGKPRQTHQLRDFILNQVEAHPTDIARVAAEQFGVSRQAVVKQLAALATEGLLVSSGTTKGRRYGLAWVVDREFAHRTSSDLQEDVVWRTEIRPQLTDISANVIEICQYGFTEILNNAIEHSESKDIVVGVRLNSLIISLTVSDSGIGIFNKIQRELKLNDPRHALLELTKGKLTTDPDRHTGEGIFFTSRMFDSFSILSGELLFSASVGADDWLIETETHEPITGTRVEMRIRRDSKRTLKDVFDQYSGQPDFDFSRTHVAVKLALYGDELLVSRSQARRILARFEKFREVLLDFSGIATIGHSFADEIFRVFKKEHPTVSIVAVNATDAIRATIKKVLAENSP